MNRRTLFQAIGATGLAAMAGRERATAAEHDATHQTASENETVCGQTVSLRLHESVTTASGISIRLADFKDHRCPVDVECVWAGYAEIWLELSGPRWEQRGYPTTEYITVGLDDQGVRRYGSFVLILDRLSPTPRPEIETPHDVYDVQLLLIELVAR